MDTRLVARIRAGKKSHWQDVIQGGSPIAASIWGKYRGHRWIPSPHLAMVSIENDVGCTTVFLWANEVIIDYPENRMA